MPPGAFDDLDAIVFTHHHFDHHHFPSLLALDSGTTDFDEVAPDRSSIRCIYPQGRIPPRFIASGLGHQAIAWTLRRLGYVDSMAVAPGDTFRIGGALIRTFPSRVPFPEMSVLVENDDAAVMFCGDALLHPAVAEWFRRPGRRSVDVAFVPTHSIAPPGVLTERRQITDSREYEQRSRETFDRYASVIDASVTVPSSFGWRIRADGENHSLEWLNRKIFPFTPAQAMESLTKSGRPALWVGPGDTVVVEARTAEILPGRKAYSPTEIFKIFASNFSEPTPAFDAAVDTVGRQRQSTDELFDIMLTGLMGSETWYQCAQTGRQHLLEIADDSGGHVYQLDLVYRTAVEVSPELLIEGPAYTRISGGTLQALIDSDLLFGSSYGLWVSNDNLLSALFHQPQFYVRYVERWMKDERGPLARNGTP
jgi:hypothetical protein